MDREMKYPSGEFGREYNRATIKDHIKSILREFDAEGKMGQTILDIGSGAHPVSEIFDSKQDKKVLNVDFFAPKTSKVSENRMIVQQDIDELSETNPDFHFKRNIVLIRKFLGINNKENEIFDHGVEEIDTLIMTDILNYLDYKKIFPLISRYLKQGGRVVIGNKPGRGRRNFFPENRQGGKEANGEGVQTNSELLKLLDDEGFEIEFLKVGEWIESEAEKEDDEKRYVTIVARKLNETEKEIRGGVHYNMAA